MTSSELRQKFLDFFAARDHRIVASSSLVPGNDRTLLFTNAGMVQFKDVFLGNESRPYKRAASSQRCVRAGGKHNDLEKVGYTTRHHTFFEMLGNFSFGDYFKREAIAYAWEFITGELGLPAEKLWITVYREDHEAADVWLNEIGADPERFSRLGKKDNFWAMGDTGPCGPCTEIFYDHGPDVAGGPPGTEDEEGDRYVEIWNLVFMQYDRTADGTMTNLPAPSVDTGMGLERIAAVMQGVHSNYDMDLFSSLIDAAAKLTRCTDRKSNSLKVIADHIRAAAFLIVDGVLPANEGRGYVLRRIIRRAIRHGYMLGMHEPFFNELIAPLAKIMGEAFPELARSAKHAAKVLLKEERRFAETLDQGMRILEDAIAGLEGKKIPGETAFKLYDTFGFPVDLTADIARERGLEVDMAGFEKEMDAQRERARQASRFDAECATKLELDVSTDFTGYDELTGSGTVAALLKEGAVVDTLASEDEGIVVLDRTPFYAEGGGQVGDVGTLSAGDGLTFDVIDTRRHGAAHLHIGRVTTGSLKTGQTVTANVDSETRASTVLNHSATHLLHAALRRVLGEHVVQKGSLVAPDRLRFDFSHNEPVSADELALIEKMVNEEIRRNVDAEASLMNYDEAIKAGALAFFGEKYGDEVRVLKFGDFSTELCGGTHVRRVGDIGFFKILAETGIAAGVRRIEAATGKGALAWVEKNEAVLGKLTDLLRSGRDDLVGKVERLLKGNRNLEKQLEKLKKDSLGSTGGSDQEEVVVNGARLIVRQFEGEDARSLRAFADHYKASGASAVLTSAEPASKKPALWVVSLTKDDAKKVSAKEIGTVALKGKGGGRADFAQGGGLDPAVDARKAIEAWAASARQAK